MHQERLQMGRQRERTGKPATPRALKVNALSVPVPSRFNGLRPIRPPCLGCVSEFSGMLLR
eukprot:8209430-Pyramimonas_sp.AAC.1